MKKLWWMGCIFGLVSSSILHAQNLPEPSGNTTAGVSSAPPLSPPAAAAAVPTVQTNAVTQVPTLAQVVVTANRLDTPVSQVTSSLTVLTAKDLEQKQAGTALDALQDLPGLNIVQTGGPGQTSDVFIRGDASEHTLVLMDGIPLNDPVGTPFDYEYLDGLALDDVQQIEVVRGPQSTLWGSSAIGGVINIIPQSGPASLGGSILMEGGSYGTSRESVSAQGGGNDGYFNFNASHTNTSGFPALSVKGLDASDAASEPANAGWLNNGDDDNTASLRLGSSLASNLEEKVLIRYSQSNTSIDTFNSSYVLADDPDDFALQKQFTADSHTDWELLDGTWEQQLSLSFSDDNRFYTATANPYNTYYANGNFDGQTAQVNWQNNIRLAKEETVILGIQGQEQWVYETYDSGYTDLGPYPSDDIPVTSVQIGSGFVESQTSIDDRLFFNLGGRWEDHSQFGVHTTYQAGLAYRVPGLETQLKANYGTGFAAPSLYQLYDPTYGNPDLKPETSVGYDIGFEQPIGPQNSLSVGADYFDSDLTNLFESGPAPDYLLSNIGKARTYGVESFVEFKGVQNLDIKGNYTYTDAWDITDNMAILRRPQNKASGDVDYQWGAVGLGTSLVYVGNSLDEDFEGNIVTLPSYFLVNLRASYQLSTDIRLFGRVDNLFNQYYEETYGYGTPGLSAYGGTKISF